MAHSEYRSHNSLSPANGISAAVAGTTEAPAREFRIPTKTEKPSAAAMMTNLKRLDTKVILIFSIF